MLVFAALLATALIMPPRAQAAQDYNLGWMHWGGADPNTYYRLAPSLTTQGQYYGGPAFVAEARKAAATWSNHHNSDTQFFNMTPTPYDFYFWWTSYSSGQQYDNTLGFASLETGTLGYNQFTPESLYTNYFTRFNSNLYWTTDPWAQQSRYDFRSCAAHELGHAAWLMHGSNTNYDSYTWSNRPTMFAAGGQTGPNYTWSRDLASGDYMGLNEQYHLH
jgi:Matrixin